jgi:hypothetical protein
VTEKNVQEIEDAALGAYVRSRKALEIAKERVNQVSAQMRQFSIELSLCSGTDLSPARIESVPWLNPTVIRDLAADVTQAETALDAARRKAVRLGVAVPF